jgi:hypothetical protein
MSQDIYRGPGAPLVKSGFRVDYVGTIERHKDEFERALNKWFIDHELIEIAKVVLMTDEMSDGWGIMIRYKILSMDPEPDVCFRAKVFQERYGDKLTDAVQFFIDSENPIEILSEFMLPDKVTFTFLMIYKKRR